MLEDKNKILSTKLAVERHQHVATRMVMSAAHASVQYLITQKAALQLSMKVCCIRVLHATIQKHPNP